MELSVQFFRTFEKDFIVSAAKKATKEMFADYIAKETKEKQQNEISEKGKLISDIIKKSDFGCKRENVVKLCEALTGEKIMDFYRKEEDNLSYDFVYSLFACFVVKQNMDSFNIDDVLIVVNTAGYVFSFDALNGNDIEEYCEEEYDNDYLNAHYIRPATDEEIEAYFEKIYPLLQR